MELITGEIITYLLQSSPVIAIFALIIKVIWGKYQSELEYNKQITKSNEEILTNLSSVIQSIERQNDRNSDEVRKELMENSRKLQGNIDYSVERILKKLDKIEDEK